MHPNNSFRQASTKENISFAQQRSFGTLALNAPSGPLLSHIPFQLSDDGKHLEAHLVRSNPILKLLNKPAQAVVSVTGSDAYISPDWYGVDEQVPTWNYVAVHLRGRLEKLPQGELHGVLERLSTAMETRLLPKKPWTISKMDQEIYTKMQKQIVPIRMAIEDIQGTWKLGQNKGAEAVHGAADGLESSPIGSEIEELIRLMRSG